MSERRQPPDKGITGQTLPQHWTAKEEAEFSAALKTFSMFKDVMDGLQRGAARRDPMQTLQLRKDRIRSREDVRTRFTGRRLHAPAGSNGSCSIYW